MIVSSGSRVFYGSAVVLLFQLACVEVVGAMPAFARIYDVPCTTCHSAFPRLNPVGAMFADEWSFRLPNWEERTTNLGDHRLRLPAQLPLGIRAQAFVQGREGESIDPVSGDVEADSTTDFQTR